MVSRHFSNGYTKGGTPYSKPPLSADSALRTDNGVSARFIRMFTMCMRRHIDIAAAVLSMKSPLIPL